MGYQTKRIGYYVRARDQTRKPTSLGPLVLPILQDCIGQAESAFADYPLVGDSSREKVEM